jgi:hypothetical protein
MHLLENLPINSQWISWLATVSALSFLISLVLIPWLITKLPSDYFTRQRRPVSTLHKQHPIIYIVAILIKNSMATLLILAGILMLILPGQGILTILIGIGLSDFPKKYQLERWFAKKPTLLNSMNWLRKKANIEPLQAPKT